jgi:hypothetical protein
MDAGTGPVEVPQEDQTESGSSYVITVPPREKKAPPNPRVYNVREDLQGNVEMRPIRAADQPSDVASPSVKGRYWLIALRSGLIYAAERYSAQENTFQFTTRGGTEFVVSRSEIDLPFTEQLNRDLGWTFGYP